MTHKNLKKEVKKIVKNLESFQNTCIFQFSEENDKILNILLEDRWKEMQENIFYAAAALKNINL